jgi:N-acetylmuramoyl-L-alanine amidase
LAAPIYLRSTAENKKLAKELFIVGGSSDKLIADKITLLSGPDRFATAAAVKKYLG